jgi:hypothetical protein
MTRSNSFVHRGRVAGGIRKAIIPVLAILIFAAISTTLAFQGKSGIGGIQGDANAPYAIGLWGDLPYSVHQATVGLPNLFADMNSQKLAFVVHDGDLKQGSNSPCDNALYASAITWFNSLEAPAIFTPGDNDWTDCDRANNGGFNSLERLSYERKVFFSTPYTLGQRTFQQEVQATPLCKGFTGNEACVENRRWTYGRVTYATLNVQGSCDNLCDTNPDPDEWAKRKAANIQWLRDTFADATARGSVAIMLIAQADPGFDGSDGTRAPLRNPTTLAETDANPDGYKDYLVELRTQVMAFRKPVAYVHGDSHYFRVDKPLLDGHMTPGVASPGRRIENFTRVETFGDNGNDNTLSNDVQWIKVLVDPSSREVFAYQPQIVPGNRIAVPAP